jgi:sugar phosphate isomerase/epimerase
MAKSIYYLRMHAMMGLPQISISTAGLSQTQPSTSSDPRAVIDFVHAQSVRAIVLDTMIAGFRARELSRSARRDLAASLRRRELDFTGLDLWIPPEHYIDPINAQRAIEAVSQACELSAELAALVGARSRPIVSVLLPSDLGQPERQSLSQSAQRVGALIADHQPDHQPDHTNTGIGVGIDPCLVLMNASSPGKAITQAGANLVSARLCDVNAMGRCAVGSTGSKLDLKGYAGALVVASLQAPQDWVTLDLRQLPDPVQAIEHARHAWADAGTL